MSESSDRLVGRLRDNLDLQQFSSTPEARQAGVESLRTGVEASRKNVRHVVSGVVGGILGLALAGVTGEPAMVALTPCVTIGLSILSR